MSLAYYLCGEYVSAIEWAERSINRMPRWFYAHFVLAASHVAIRQDAKAAEAVKACMNELPDICILDLDRVPLKDPQKMAELRERLHEAGFSE
jgi:hypothetical protein